MTYRPIPLGTEQSPPKWIAISDLALTFDGGVEDPEPAPVEVVVDRRQVVHVERHRVRRRPRRIPDRRAGGDRPAHRPRTSLPARFRPRPRRSPPRLAHPGPTNRPTARAAAGGGSSRRDPEGRVRERRWSKGREVWMETTSRHGDERTARPGITFLTVVR